MHRNVFLKLGVIGILSVMLLIPLAMIRGVVSERQQYRNTAERDIATSWSDRQTVLGPIIEIPYREQITIKVFDAEQKKVVEKTEWKDRQLHILPEQLSIRGDLHTEERYRGIYTFPVYTATLALDGRFSTKHLFGLERPPEVYQFGDAVLYMGIADVRGIKNQLQLQWQKKQIEFQPGGHPRIAAAGVRAPLGTLTPVGANSYDFNFTVELRGMKEVHFAPIGKQTTVQLQSPWQHPKFTGRFLPEQRAISENGFTAEWTTTHFATNSPQQLKGCFKHNNDHNECWQFQTTLLGVELFEPVDIYQQVERSMKYGVLFIVLTFVAFFLFEVLRQLRIHPIQYTLVGCALAMFYLLLVSLSEHISFGAAYTLAGTASILLITFYVCAVLASVRIGLFFGAGVTLLYGVLFVLLQSEDFALIMGSALLFIALAAVMGTTRHIDWYQVANGSKKEPT